MTNDRVFTMLVQTKVLMGISFCRPAPARDALEIVERAAEVPEEILADHELAAAAEEFVEAATGHRDFPDWWREWRALGQRAAW